MRNTTTSSHLRHKVKLLVIITYLKFKFVYAISAGSEEEDFEGFEDFEEDFDYLSS